MEKTRDIYDVTNDLFTIFEKIRDMFRHWEKQYSEEFIHEVRKLDPLEKELEELIGDKDKAFRIRVGIYRSVFPEATRWK